MLDVVICFRPAIASRNGKEESTLEFVAADKPPAARNMLESRIAIGGKC